MGNKVLHIGFDQPYQQYFIENIQGISTIEDQVFVLFSDTKSLKYVTPDLVTIIKFLSTEYYDFLSTVIEFDKIIVHFLGAPCIHLINNAKIKSTTEITWIFWGADGFSLQKVSNFHLGETKKFLNAEQRQTDLFKNILKKALLNLLYQFNFLSGSYSYEKRMLSALSKVKYCGSHVGHDLKLLQSKYKETRKIEHKNFFYSDFESYSGITDSTSRQPEKKTFTILAGNSGNSSNNHLDIFLKIKKNHNQQVEKIICPLSYGGTPNYVQHIEKKGKELFGDRFTAILKLMSKEKYSELLLTVDIAYFMHIRQQAFGNTFLLITMEKTIYMISESTLFKELRDKKILIKDASSAEYLTELSKSEKLANKEKIMRIYSRENMIEAYKNLIN